MMKAVGAALIAVAAADISADLVEQMPDFDKVPFKIYSGLLDVPGPINGYDSLKIHYQFHTSQRSPQKDPVVTWHQGGPGGSSIEVGLYTEMGYFNINDHGAQTNPYAWNRVANMLYFESPAGSGSSAGFSVCLKNEKPVTCSWTDVTQGEAYAHSLQAFFKAFPEFAENDLYLTGESYFGQYGPNIAHFIVNNEPFKSSINLKGLALGNACWGGDATTVQCNGPNSQRNDVELFFGKGLFSSKLHKEILDTCEFPSTSLKCMGLLMQMNQEVGPHNVYNIYDNCPQTETFLKKTGKDMKWLTEYLRSGMSNPHETHANLQNMSGGYPWACGGPYIAGNYLTRADVRKALHLDTFQPGASRFSYRSSGPASITLYPELVKKLRIMIYNGDADACVPYIGNEEWISDLETQGVLKESQAWTPWFTEKVKRAPAGYVTKYTVPGSDQEFKFVTIRLAGHMVPTFQPEAAFDMFSTFLEEGAQKNQFTV
jgi:carboxypeptidase C (cathepsin A)